MATSYVLHPKLTKFSLQSTRISISAEYSRIEYRHRCTRRKAKQLRGFKAAFAASTDYIGDNQSRRCDSYYRVKIHNKSNQSLLTAQRRRRIQARGAERRKPRGQERDNQEQHGDGCERHRIRGLDLDQHARQNAREGKGCEQTNYDTNHAQVESLPDHQTEDA